MNTCICPKCKIEKTPDDFYDSIVNCKECHKSYVKKNRKALADHYKEYDRKRANNPDRVAARAAYAKTPEGKAKGDAAKARWAKKNKLKRQAHSFVSNGIRDGKITKQPCEKCGVEPAEAHHDSYDHPEIFRWLCTQHHAEYHVLEREQARLARRAAKPTKEPK